MDKKCTLIAAALMVAGVFSANAQSSTTVPEAQWKAGNYYYLKTGSSVLSLSGEKADSVIVKTLASDATKAAIDSALWQITNAGTTCWSCVSIQEQEDTGRFVVCGFIYGKACYHIGRESVDIL